MKKILLTILLCGVMVFSITGCSSEKENVENNNTEKGKSQQDIIMTCTSNSKPENEYEATSTTTEVYTYDNNMILKKIKVVREEEYSSEERANSQKSIHEGAVNRANEMEGVSGTIETKSNTSFVYSFTYNLEKITNLEELNIGLSEYLDYSTHKFDADKYADTYADNNNTELSNGTCVFE